MERSCLGVGSLSSSLLPSSWGSSGAWLHSRRKTNQSWTPHLRLHRLKTGHAEANKGVSCRFWPPPLFSELTRGSKGKQGSTELCFVLNHHLLLHTAESDHKASHIHNLTGVCWSPTEVNSSRSPSLMAMSLGLQAIICLCCLFVCLLFVFVFAPDLLSLETPGMIIRGRQASALILTV